ncbi:MAG TPA: SRPBCC domain-containing protein [Candidatus Limnocylindrales bacterium]|nr:SRPBCC domain-containing protein [Candidatus Limnocylindrales bacterium]
MTDVEPQPAPNTLVEREVTIPASPEIVWEYLTDPDRIVSWMGSRAELEPVPGSDLRVEYANGAVMRGTVTDVEAPSRLAFTWGWEDPAEAVRPGGSRVEVTLEEMAGGTRVLVRHLDLPEAERESHAEGWDYFLGRLADAVG